MNRNIRNGGHNWSWTSDTSIFSAVLYLLSYVTVSPTEIESIPLDFQSSEQPPGIRKRVKIKPFDYRPILTRKFL